MYTGYVALLDVLGFSNLIAADNAGERVQRYLDCLKVATEGTDVEFVVFSDSIVLTVRDEPDALIEITSACSRLMHDLVLEGIPVRGAISKGQILRETVGHNVFVAGRAVVEAYNFEQQQDWVGIMLAPSAVQGAPELSEMSSYWLRLGSRQIPLEEIETHIAWAASLQWCHSIPFHTESPFDENGFAGFVVIPHSGGLQPMFLRDSLQTVIDKLNWLRMIAPTPAAQKKYSNSANFLQAVQRSWQDYAREQERRDQRG